MSAQDVEGIDRSVTMSTCPPGRVFYAPNVMEDVLFLLKKDQVQFYRLSSVGEEARSHRARRRGDLRRDVSCGTGHA